MLVGSMPGASDTDRQRDASLDAGADPTHSLPQSQRGVTAWLPSGRPLGTGVTAGCAGPQTARAPDEAHGLSRWRRRPQSPLVSRPCLR
jgi:hypothetical protein